MKCALSSSTSLARKTSRNNWSHWSRVQLKSRWKTGIMNCLLPLIISINVRLIALITLPSFLIRFCCALNLQVPAAQPNKAFYWMLWVWFKNSRMPVCSTNSELLATLYVHINSKPLSLMANVCESHLKKTESQRQCAVTQLLVSHSRRSTTAICSSPCRDRAFTPVSRQWTTESGKCSLVWEWLGMKWNDVRPVPPS